VTHRPGRYRADAGRRSGNQPSVLIGCSTFRNFDFQGFRPSGILRPDSAAVDLFQLDNLFSKAVANFALPLPLVHLTVVRLAFHASQAGSVVRSQPEQ
jgi:hypothetical protein